MSLLRLSLLLTMCQPSGFGTSFADMAEVNGVFHNRHKYKN